MVFSKSKTIIGFTGTLGGSTIKQNFLFHTKSFEKLKVSLKVDKPDNKITKKLIFNQSLIGYR
jgi:hypothetical protein